MKNALDTIKGWAWGFIDLMLIFIAVGVLVQVIFGSTATFFDGMVANLEWHKRFTKNFSNVNWVIIDDVIKTSYCAMGVKKGNYSLRDFLNLALYELQSADVHNEIWRKHWGRDPLVKVLPNPYF